MRCHLGCEKQASLSLFKEQTTMLSLLPFDTYLTTVCFIELGRQVRQVFTWTFEVSMRRELFCSDSSEIFLCLTALCSWLILKISFLIVSLADYVTGFLPPAWSHDPVPLRLTPVGQKHESPQGIPLRPGNEKAGRKKTQDLTPKIFTGCLQAS